ncbi:antimicrobial peptide system SdpB family protein [Saccharopolyspora lacisalsi]|uniref:Antimicrobial peptide system SdpB family protein n=1 Tax=Halosaccharopolyspora lacisalsi TaxID=1000566 RepID=A0A839E3E5_9PSEU|nr:sporulation-delaying protein SdpB family protein [Halosaccharopolyspora lacisalsi]MBA8827570.1 antimicrobial peptide system SdpB family protein [Halosaccharopolyspora lacisalsi]
MLNYLVRQFSQFIREPSRLPVPWGPAYGAARTFLALGVAGTLIFSSDETLFHPVAQFGSYPKCDGISGGSLFCLVPSDSHNIWRFVAAGILLVVASGWRPRVTALPHAWITFSFHTSISIPDGGDQVSMILAILLLPVALTDPRKWHWNRQHGLDGESGTPWKNNAVQVSAVIGVTGLVLARLQVVGIYFQSGLAKLAVPEWVDGTALYYWINSPTFGASPWLRPLLSWIVEVPVGVALLTWLPLVLELALALSVLNSSRRLRAILLPLGVTFHALIAVVMGLWSFAAAMTGALLLLLVPIGGPVSQLYHGPSRDSGPDPSSEEASTTAVRGEPEDITSDDRDPSSTSQPGAKQPQN